MNLLTNMAKERQPAPVDVNNESSLAQVDPVTLEFLEKDLANEEVCLIVVIYCKNARRPMVEIIYNKQLAEITRARIKAEDNCKLVVVHSDLEAGNNSNRNMEVYTRQGTVIVFTPEELKRIRQEAMFVVGNKMSKLTPLG